MARRRRFEHVRTIGEAHLDLDLMPPEILENFIREQWEGLNAFYADPKNEEAFQAWLPGYRARQRQKQQEAAREKAI
ncbi:Uncharacterised protein [Anaerotruncus sp. 2789STDY5834896]|uniref:Uncharacterized protein n=1 Tax=uncultured Anaerotruncus sp. TaxID=905011 RepID=A0A1C6I9S0_9FIRM|nr:Uncharacterised protein [uncultured Anaerotruncus sp.]